MNNEHIIDLASDIICAHLSHNKVAAADVPGLIQSIYAALTSAGAPAPEAKLEPAVSIRSSVKPGAITCLECGAKLKTLKRHIATSHGLSADEYRARWALPASYPLVSADYSQQRSDMATRLGLGRKPGQGRKASTLAKGASPSKPVRKTLKISV